MLITCICGVSHSLDAQTPEPSKPTSEPGKQKEFIYVLRLVPRLYDDEKWTKEDNAVLDPALHSIPRSDKIRSIDSAWTHKRAK